MSEDVDDGDSSKNPLWELDEQLRTRRRGLVRRAALYASGVDRRILRAVPVEETSYVVLGTFVILTAGLAGFGTALCAGYWLKGHPEFSLPEILCGIGAFFFIFTFDRALVRAPLNPYEFPPEILEALWNPAADSKWFAVLNDALSRPSVGRRLRQSVGVLSAAFLRIVVSFCVSFLIAETVMFIIFNQEITARVTFINNQSVTSAVAAENAQYKTDSGSLASQIKELGADGDATVMALDAQIAPSTAAVSAVNQDIQLLDNLKTDEIYSSSRQCVTLSTKQTVCSSGKIGNGPEALAITQSLSERSRALTTDKANLQVLQTNRTNAYNAAQGRARANKARITALTNTLNALTTAHTTRLTNLENGTGDVKGILIRHDALSDLESDHNPETLQVDGSKACPGGFSGAFCSLGRSVWPRTPAGAYVVSLRLVFLIIDLMPMILKIQMSLKRRRPYDALHAALEERYSASAIDLVDRKLIVVGEGMESRATRRKAARAGSGAETLLRAEGWLKHLRRPSPKRIFRKSHLSDAVNTVRRGYRADDEAEVDVRLRPPVDIPKQSRPRHQVLNLTDGADAKFDPPATARPADDESETVE